MFNRNIIEIFNKQSIKIIYKNFLINVFIRVSINEINILIMNGEF